MIDNGLPLRQRGLGIMDGIRNMRPGAAGLSNQTHTGSTLLRGITTYLVSLTPGSFQRECRVIGHVDARHAVPDSWRGLSQASEYK